MEGGFGPSTPQPMEIDMKLTYAYIVNKAKRDKRIDGIEDCRYDNQVIVWLDPAYTWCANDGNITCMIYNVEHSEEYQDTVERFLTDLKMIERAI